jgi:hypothetical protein
MSGQSGLRVLGAPARAGENEERVKCRPDVIVYRGNYPGWPWVTRRQNGQLICVFRDDSVHGFSPTGKVMWTASDDNGSSWSPAQIVVDEPDVDDRNAAVVELPDKTLMVCYNTYTKDRVSCAMVTQSKDNGVTWEPPRMIADLDARTRGAPIVLSSGDLLLPFYKAPGNGSLAARSADVGKSWKILSVPGPGRFVGDEWVVHEVEEGRVIGIIRENGIRDGYFWKTESRDGGRTWEMAARTNVRDARSTSPAHLDMHGSTPVLTYADRRMISVSMVTTDDARFVKWDLEGRLLCYRYRPDGERIADASYPVSVAVGNSRRFIVDYEIRPEGRWIAGYFVDLPEHWQ